MFPEIPADLSALSIEELQALQAQIVAWAQANATGEPTTEALAAMGSVADGHARVVAELAARAAATPPEAPPAAAPVLTLAEMAAAIVAAVPTPAPAAPAPPAGQAAAETPPAAAVPTLTAEQFTAGISAAVTAAVQAVMPAPAELIELTAAGDALQAPPLGRIQGGPASPVATVTPIRPDVTITASADIPGFPLGAPLEGLFGVGQAIIARREQIGQVPLSSAPEKIIVARVASGMPADRILEVGNPAGNQSKIANASPLLNPGLVASGGSCVPVQPYYSLMVQSGAMRPVRDALLGFGVDSTRGGVKVLQPPNISSPGTVTRTVTDGVTTNTSTTVTSATGAFVGPGQGGVGGDVGALISGAGIPAGAYIVVVNSATSVTISAAATATATGVTLTIVRQGAVSYITNAVDAAALNGTTAQQIAALKNCIHVECPTPLDVQVAAVSYCLEFGNFTTRAFPEQMPAWLQLTLAIWARVAETKLLDRMSATSTQITATGIVGALRSLVTQQIKAAAYFRNRNRLDDSVTLRVLMPRWVLDLGAVDLILGSGYDSAYLTQARQFVTTAFAEANLVPSYYIDSGTGKGQLFAPGGVQGAKHGAAALVAFPGTVVWYMYPEGSYMFLDGGFLDFGMWRDSGLNSANNYRLMAETFEELAPMGYEMLEVTSTVVANGTFAGPAYGSTTLGSPVAIPATF